KRPGPQRRVGYRAARPQVEDRSDVRRRSRGLRGDDSRGRRRGDAARGRARRDLRRLTMDSYLMIRLEGPLQAWGDVAVDGRRATRAFPSRSALAALIASALGWTYRDGARTTALQDAMRFAVREDRRPTL